MRINLSLKKARVGDIFTSRLFVYDVTLSNFHGDKCSTMRTFGVKHIFYALMIDNSFCVFTKKKKKWIKIHFLSIVRNCLSVTRFSYKWRGDINERHHSHSQSCLVQLFKNKKPKNYFKNESRKVNWISLRSCDIGAHLSFC